MNLTTRNGHNMYDMASMLQKAIRRNSIGYAMYAAYELYGGYYAMLWKRLVVISAEDCYGMITKQIVDLKNLDDTMNYGKKGYDRDLQYVEKAVKILCAAKKNRDACYAACNFMIVDWGCSEVDFQKVGHIRLNEWVSEIKKDSKDESKEQFKQYSLFDFM